MPRATATLFRNGRSLMTETETPARLLIIDDTPVNLRLLIDMLRQQAYTVRGVSNGDMGLTIAAAQQPDLILLDIDMPEMDGYEVCRRLKASDATSEIPVVFLSALDQPLDKVKAFEVGGIDYISKPFRVEEVLARVRMHLDHAALARAVAERNTQLEEANARLKETNRQLQEEKRQRQALATKLTT